MSNAFGFNNAASVAQRQQAQMEAGGYYAENFARGGVSSASAMVTGTVYYCGIGLMVGDRVTNALVACNIAGSAFTGIGMRFALYSKAGAMLASTGDASASFSASGAKTIPFTAGYDVTATDGYYVALLAVATTGPALLRGPTGTNGSGFFTGGALNTYGTQASQTDLPTTPTMITNSGILGFWVGIS